MKTKQDLLTKEPKNTQEFNIENSIGTSFPLENDVFYNRYRWIFEQLLTPLEPSVILHFTEFDTPLGLMLAASTSKGICLLEFTNRIRLEKEIIDLQKLLNAAILPGKNQHLGQLENELNKYFEGKLKDFLVPLHIPGNEFSQLVWAALQKIPYGKTCSYKKQAAMMNNPKAIRAIAATNGKNRIAIVIPCHRVIGSDGSLTGYAAGIEKKKWLINFERSHSEIPQGTLF